MTIHLGVGQESDPPARRIRPSWSRDWRRLVTRLEDAGHAIQREVQLTGIERVHVATRSATASS